MITSFRVEHTERRISGAWLPVAAATVGNLIWGFSNTFTQVAFGEAGPEIVLATRFVVAILFMTGLIVSGQEKMDFHKPYLGRLFGLGLIELLYFYCESYGIVYTNVTCSGVVLAVSPIVAMVLAAVFLKEIPSGVQVCFSIVAVVGVILITLVEGAAGEVTPVGIILLVGGCICSSVFRIINRTIVYVYTTFERTYIVILVSALSFSIAAVMKGNISIGSYMRLLLVPNFILPVLVLGLCSSVGANLMMNYAAKELPVVKLAVFGAISTICSMAGGVLFLGEPVTVVSILGIALILMGIWQVNK